MAKKSVTWILIKSGNRCWAKQKSARNAIAALRATQAVSSPD
jgi:hypothetical protein